MTRGHKKVIRLLVYGLLAYFVTRPMYYPGVGPYPLPRTLDSSKVQTKWLSFQELNDFLVLWSEFLTLDFNDKNVLHLLNKAPQETQKLSSHAQKWIKDHDWDVDHFFYVGKRIVSLLQACQIKIDAKNSRDSLEAQIKATKDPVILEGIQRLIMEQNRMHLKGDLTEGEIEMVMPHRMTIQNILTGKMLYQPKPAH